MKWVRRLPSPELCRWCGLNDCQTGSVEIHLSNRDLAWAPQSFHKISGLAQPGLICLQSSVLCRYREQFARILDGQHGFIKVDLVLCVRTRRRLLAKGRCSIRLEPQSGMLHIPRVGDARGVELLERQALQCLGRDLPCRWGARRLKCNEQLDATGTRDGQLAVVQERQVQESRSGILLRLCRCSAQHCHQGLNPSSLDDRNHAVVVVKGEISQRPSCTRFRQGATLLKNVNQRRQRAGLQNIPTFLGMREEVLKHTCRSLLSHRGAASQQRDQCWNPICLDDRDLVCWVHGEAL
mmetsp:Transcript_49678/g.133443  ORF Transcript_49678/g.133443 Transcript_49678/m.133443 type:complete len:295 (-) Transcript_49678:514-1398(-)